MTRHLHIDPSREPLPPDDELWGEGEMLHAHDGDAVGSGDAAATGNAGSRDDALDASLRALARDTYHVHDAGVSPVDALHVASERIPRDAMWAAISSRRREHESAGNAISPSAIQSTSLSNAQQQHSVTVQALTPRQSKRYWPALAALAATLVVGVSIGRGFGARGPAVNDATSVADGNADIAPRGSNGLPVMLAELTTQHFASTEALLVTARQGMSSSVTDASVAEWARDLLLSTRLLLDTDELRDLRTRRLLQDLELTLALIVQAQSSGRDADAQTVRDDLERGDLLLRVRSAAMPMMNSTTDIRGMSE